MRPFFQGLYALYAILLRPALYIRLAAEHGDVGAEEHRAVFAAQWRDAFAWTTFGGLLAAIGLLACGRLSMAPLDTVKVLAVSATWLQALATWFALANAADTWDREERLDTALRSLHFKLLFFPGLAVQLAGAAW